MRGKRERGSEFGTKAADGDDEDERQLLARERRRLIGFRRAKKVKKAEGSSLNDVNNILGI